MAVPSSLQFLASKFDSVSSQSIRLETTGARTGLKAQQTIQFNLPTNAVLNMHSLQIHGDLAVTGTSARIPDGVKALISRIEVQVGGQTMSGMSIGGGEAYNMLRKLKDQTADLDTEHGVILAPTGVTSSYALDGAISDSAESAFISFKDWDYGMLACEPRYLPTQIMPSIQVRITLAPNAVIPGSGASYTLNNVFATCEVLNLQSQAYDAMVSDVMSNNGYLPVVWREATVNRSNFNGVSRQTSASRCIARVLGGFRHIDFDQQQAPLLLPAYGDFATGGATGRYVAPAGAFGTVTSNGAGTDKCCVSTSEIYWDASGARFPMWQSSLRDWVGPLKSQALYDDEKPTSAECKPAQHNLEAGAIMAARFDLASSSNPRLSSGIDSRGASLVLTLNGDSSVTSKAISYMVMETVPLLQIGSNRQCAIVH